MRALARRWRSWKAAQRSAVRVAVIPGRTRIDGQITLPDGRDLAAVMVAANQAAPWDGHGVKPVPAGGAA